jgi:hypothetical protein
MRTAMPLTVLATALACSFATAPAHARARVFVASYGSDSNPCTFLSPCRNFQQAVNVVDAGGEVTAIDSAGFGPITITKSVTITSPAGVEAGIAADANGNAITINAGSGDTVTVRGLTLNGGGASLGGIVLNSGKRLRVLDCMISGFGSGSSGSGIFVTGSSGTSLFVSKTRVFDNANGIYVWPSGSALVNAELNQVEMDNNNVGVLAQATDTTGFIIVHISDSVVAGSSDKGIWALGGRTSGPAILVRSSSIDHNNVGLESDASSSIRVGRSTVQNYWDANPLTPNDWAASGGTAFVSSYGDNIQFQYPSSPVVQPYD